MNDIETETDVRHMVDEFYAAIREDALLNPIFSDVAQVDWAHHLPKMYAFWNGMILGKPGYVGAPFAAHVTVDRNFAGVGATRAKNAAASIAHTFAMRMGLVDPAAGKFV